ncbi:PTS sugar transporter subunit IIA [Micavibrio aeruginosavorus]|uniref:PTS IIA-like nitrogen-regulatory protein PtsN n=1 Tax=Micavibrio aeruginosavorus EPB TaxID=349215 RepID=M4VCT1_9BACT|nr:PTS sugar transporter subunit IIA [Micavibrio aeruginosavorus]AGH97008.1 PTS IIA-like nitrogen-regulatory protein PtsN [Micavibrio aeruginosavorus EPB]
MSDSVFHIDADLVLPLAKLPTRRKIIDRLADLAASPASMEPAAIAARLLQRERQATSGIGGGVAIPHLRLRLLDRPVFVMMTLAGPVDFDAVDRQPVDIVAMLLSPEADGPLHLRRLARLSRLLRDDAVCTALRRARSESDIRMALDAPMVRTGGMFAA